MCSPMHFGLYKPLQERCHRIPSSLQFCPYSRRKARMKFGTGTCAVPSLSNIFGQTLWLWLVFREIQKLGLPSSRQIALRLLRACKKKFVRISSDPKVPTIQKVWHLGSIGVWGLLTQAYPVVVWIYFRKIVLTCANLNCQNAIGEHLPGFWGLALCKRQEP